MSSLATENLYLAALELTEGATLKAVRVSQANGKTTAVFALEGPEVERVADAFWRGAAVVNLQDFRVRLESLKDELFGVLRRNESERRTDDAETHRYARHARR
jgi:hypothetical protein